jgi:hypothetical protein
MRTLHSACGQWPAPVTRVYQAAGYTVAGTVEGTTHGTLSMLQLPDDPFVTGELVHDPGPPTTPTASPRPTSPEQAGPYPRGACQARRDRPTPATITPGYSIAIAQVAISPNPCF